LIDYRQTVRCLHTTSPWLYEFGFWVKQLYLLPDLGSINDPALVNPLLSLSTAPEGNPDLCAKIINIAVQAKNACSIEGATIVQL